MTSWYQSANVGDETLVIVRDTNLNALVKVTKLEDNNYNYWIENDCESGITSYSGQEEGNVMTIDGSKSCVEYDRDEFSALCSSAISAATEADINDGGYTTGLNWRNAICAINAE